MRVAVLSLAHEHASTYARVLHEMPDVELLIADPDGSPDGHALGQRVAGQLGVSYANDWDEVFEWLPNAVVITSEVGRHRELVERMAEAETFVLCAQPLAPTELDVKAMVDACDMAGVRLTVASPACHSEAFAAVRRGIADGVVGTLTTIHGSYHTPPVGGDGGVLAVNAAYLLDLVDMVLDGDPATRVYAQTNTVLSGRTGAESAAVLTVSYRGGIVASFDCGWSRSAGGPALTFVGDRASVEYDAAPRLLGGFDAAAGGERWEPGGEDLYPLMLRDFLGTIETGTGVGPDGQAGLRTQRIIEAAHTSLRTGQPVDIG
ncbi:Gfo/Idh/MocA family oxidoreductase [Micromonospora sp. WMMA1363]|uniref:Gfo/Idh/MocA family protein n=1 Tax=Micromonospora sp. WMMA1363 TaxID=3053985 RepID=UPI00259CFC2E|nr:Gfo/Idh/MocA family oxidoreductase [Micromonospora sp. WMMA1363]MDM4723009.1 Gfo/Idh/MocA family oxidoreductase [Micromonospora sp. WMMA1363]